MFIPIINRFTCKKNQLSNIKQLINNRNMKCIFDYTNENQKKHRSNFKEIMNLTSNMSNETIAVKLSSLKIDSKIHVENYLDEIIRKSICNNNKILIDAENYNIQDQINLISNKFMEIYNKDALRIYKTYQLYRTDYLDILRYDLEKSRNYKIGFKIVRGAYYNEDKKYNILFDNIESTHENYNKGIKLFVNNHQIHDKLLCATHNEKSIQIATEFINKYKLNNIEFAQLMGMSDKLSNKLSNEHIVYKYIPYGDFKDTFPYLLRRLYENYPMIMNILN